MPAVPDPYRTLGLGRDATTEEIRRAYRRLAKANHPDSAGEAALPRFLAIQAAYELLVGPPPGRRPGVRPAAARSPQPAHEPWRADPERARATREASERRTGRRPGARPPGGGSATRAGDPATGDPATGRPAAGGPAAGATGDGWAESAAPPGSRRRGERRRAPKKATLGSTSYDAAEDEPFEPEWSGGTWYGASSGTYWTINPKEYADPRKHGPEYQRRANRRLDEAPGIAEDAAEDQGGWPPTTNGRGHGDAPDGDPPAGDARTERRANGDPAARHSSAGPFAAASASARQPVGGMGLPPAAGLGSSGLLAGFGGRIALALVGWPPIGVGLATIEGELTGCSRFAASCVEPLEVGTWLAQLVIIAILLALPSVAAIASIGTVAALAAAVPTAVFLSATGGSREPVASAVVLAVVLATAWLVGVVLAIARRLRPRLR
ncbi:MAG TPA: DnaJ domain-containing protein [Candidatus Limnocylindrales bacterium]|nr:DnaJ domain-containing protein [Candidatus Limnocylindrales bacterium]